MNMSRSARKVITLFLSLIILFSMYASVQAQNAVATDKTTGTEQTSHVTELIPTAVPVLSPAEAEKSNNEAIKEHKKMETRIARKQIFSNFLKILNALLLGVLIIVYIGSASRLTRIKAES